jgi:hypothetical protein
MNRGHFYWRKEGTFLTALDSPVYNSLDNPAPGGGYCRQARWAVPSTVIESREAPLLAERAQPTSYPKRRPAFLRTGMVQVSDTLQESGLF